MSQEKLNFDRKDVIKHILWDSHYYVAWEPFGASKFQGEEELKELGIKYKKLGNACPSHNHPAGYGEGHVVLIEIPDITAHLFTALRAGLTPIEEDDFEVE